MENLSYCCQLKSDEAFIAGLLHDIGEMVLLRILHDYQRITKQKLPAPVVDYVAQECHENLGGVLAQHWNLPEAIKPLLEHHHGEIDDYDPHKVSKCLLQITDMLCSLMGYGEKYPFDLLNTEPARLIGFRPGKRHPHALQLLPAPLAAGSTHPLRSRPAARPTALPARSQVTARRLNSLQRNTLPHGRASDRGHRVQHPPPVNYILRQFFALRHALRETTITDGRYADVSKMPRANDHR